MLIRLIKIWIEYILVSAYFQFYSLHFLILKKLLLKL